MCVSLRELEGLIFECALYMDELKEHSEQITEDLLTPEPSPSPAHSPSLSKARKYPTHPQVTTPTTLVEICIPCPCIIHEKMHMINSHPRPKSMTSCFFKFAFVILSHCVFPGYCLLKLLINQRLITSHMQLL